MRRVITTERVPIKLWLDDIEDGSLEQAKNLANLPFVFKHIAIMPDSHQGYGMPIGGVLATQSVILPNAVGVDIGCGMSSVRTPWKANEISKEQLIKIIEEIKKDIPVGFNRHSFAQSKSDMPDLEKSFIVDKEYNNALTSLGTLGGGNHFIEIQIDKEKNVWIMIHSGSRNLGKKVADYYNKRAKTANGIWHSGIPQKWDLAFLPIDSPDGKSYLQEMNFCIEFAAHNRKLMMERISKCFDKIIKHKKINLFQIIDIAHNYASMENHFGHNVMVHRKGATRARKGEIGIVPGSQGTKSYIVEGLGNKLSFESCAHGAGRKMGRKQAQKSLNLEDEITKLNERGILHSIQSTKDLDEAPGAYKDISVVMANQNDLIIPIVELSPIAVIKG